MIEEIENMETEQIIDNLYYFGVYYNHDLFMEKPRNCQLIR